MELSTFGGFYTFSNQTTQRVMPDLLNEKNESLIPIKNKTFLLQLRFLDQDSFTHNKKEDYKRPTSKLNGN